MHTRIQIYRCRSSIFRHLKLELLTQFPASNDEKYINVVYIWRKFVSFYGYVHWRMTTEISVMYGSEKVKNTSIWRKLTILDRNIWQTMHTINKVVTYVTVVNKRRWWMYRNDRVVNERRWYCIMIQWLIRYKRTVISNGKVVNKRWVTGVNTHGELGWWVW